MGLFGRMLTRNKPPERDPLRLATSVEKLLEECAVSIFVRHCTHLRDQPNTYIVPAVWGAKKDGPLSARQKEIHRRATPVIDQALASLELKGLEPAQVFAVGYLIRGLLISKVILLVEAFRRQKTARPSSEQAEVGTLEGMETVGEA